jgi:hypothetical protein
MIVGVQCAFAGVLHMHPIISLAERFQRFGERECAHVSPLYAQFARGVAADPDLLAIAAAGDGRGQPVPNLFFAAVQYLLLDGISHPLANLYPACGGTTTADLDPMPLLRDFCHQHASAIRELIATRLVQTNEVRRCALTLPAIAYAAQNQPIALLEIGTSAGLNLLPDYYHYYYHTNEQHIVLPPAQQHRTTLTLDCAIRGSLSLCPTNVPTINWRLGLDLNPIDLANPAATTWLRALIWPEQTDRSMLLQQATTIAQAIAPPVWAGDALQLLPTAIAQAPQNALLCVVHTFTVNQFSPTMRQQFSDLLAEASQQRTIAQISVEWQEPMPPLVTTIWQDRQAVTKQLAICDPHGAWISDEACEHVSM